jgi:hypothetical protein
MASIAAIQRQSPLTRWDVYRLIADCLGSPVSSRAPRIPDTDIPWPLVVEAADRHFVAPALGWCLQGNERIPSDVRQCLETLLELNGRRNELLLEGLEAAIDSLNDEGITPMLLKGAAALVEGLYPHPGMRIASDLDLLVREVDLDRADAALERAGFAAQASDPSFDAHPHHLPLRAHTQLRVGVELHRHPVPAAIGGLIDASRFLSTGRHVRWRNYDVLLPEPTGWVIHNIAHSQIIDRHYWRGIPHLRQMLELAWLRSRHRDAIDFTDAEARFARVRYGRVFADTMTLCEMLLEGRDPSTFSTPKRRAIDRTRRAVEQPATRRWEMYGQFVLRNTRRIIEHPRFVMRTLRPSFWTLHLSGIWRRVQVRRW